jgi:hypothetical protein
MKSDFKTTASSSAEVIPLYPVAKVTAAAPYDLTGFKLALAPEWRRLQTHKWRRPDWVKFPRSVHDDPRWLKLSDGAKAAWIDILLIASEHPDSELPKPEILLNRLRILSQSFRISSVSRRISELIQCGFLTKTSPELQSYRVTDKKERVVAPDGAPTQPSGSTNSDKRVGRGEEGIALTSSATLLPPSKRNVRGTRLPEDWKLSPEDERFAREGLTAEVVGVEAERFRNHWVAAPDHKGFSLDWSATWRKWCLGSRQWNPGQAASAVPKPKFTEEETKALFERYERKQAALTAGSSR